MLLVAIAWLYAVGMIAVVEATSPAGTVLGGIVTFAVYGVLPLGIVGYLFFSPARRRGRRSAEAIDPDEGRHAAGDAITPEREES